MHEIVRRSPGRPVDQEKRRRIVDIARTLWLDKGEVASLEAIAAKAGVSRQTIYNGWPNKSDLVLAVALDVCARETNPIHVPTGLPLAEALEAVARSYLGILLSPRNLRLLKLIFGLSDAQREMLLQFNSGGLLKAVEQLTPFFAQQIAERRLKRMDAALACEHFLGLLAGELLFQSVTLGARIADDTEVARRIKTAVRLFLEGHACDDCTELAA